MSFAFEIKQEVLQKEFSSENALAFLSGIVSVFTETAQGEVLIKLNNLDISFFVRDLANQLGFEIAESKENKNFIVIKDFKQVTTIKLPAYFFAGAFVGGGSISDIDSTSYHLEIQFHSRKTAEMVLTFLSKYEFNFAMIQRRTNWVIYIKKSESISDFLRAIQAFDALMAFENTRIRRDSYNQMNRYSNLDVYNMSKLALASERFRVQYQYIIDNKMQNLFTPMEIAFFELKKRNYTDSLEMLKENMNKKYNLNKTRAGLNHWLIKLRNVYEDYN